MAEPELSPAHCAAVIRDEVARIRSGLARIEGELASFENAQRPSAASRARPERYQRVLVDVYERGGRVGVDAAAFAAIGAVYGYDPRGLGGFFTGGRAPLRRVDDRVGLTVYGEQLVDEYLSRLG